jgi:hydroxyacylglutathione hydrolase
LFRRKRVNYLRIVIQLASFVFNPFQENTYVLHDETKQCAIIDPGCYYPEEKNLLSRFIEENNLTPVKLLLTHTHIDHIMGNNYVCGKYRLKIEMNELEVTMLQNAKMVGDMYGIAVEPSPPAEIFLSEGDTVRFGTSELKILFTPGHSVGSLCFYNAEQKFAIAGDVLFNESIGRTDLPGGDYDTLINSIREKLFTLPDDFKIFPGHGADTTIGHEKKFNPFLA